jgi:hypothetical protein
MALDWTQFFQFSTNDQFKIREEDNWLDDFTGTGKVLDRNGNKLVLELNIPPQTISLSGFLPSIAGVDSLSVPKIKATVSITLFNEGQGNRLEVQGTFINSNNQTESFNYTDINLKAELRHQGRRIRLDASNTFLSQISDNSNIAMLARLEFEKTTDLNENEMDVGKFPLGEKIELFLVRGVGN